MASTLNSIMKSTMFFFPCLKDSILYLVSAAFVLLLNFVLIYLTKSSQSWVPNSSSSSSSFFCALIPTTPPLRRVRITVILSSVSITLLLLRNSQISLHQSSNFILSPSNHPGSRTILLGIAACPLFIVGTGTGAVDISVSVCLYLLEASSVIRRNPSYSNNAFILFVLLELILVLFCSLYYMYFVQQVTLSSFICGFYFPIPLLQGELVDV